jgi:hypothetical protein
MMPETQRQMAGAALAVSVVSLAFAMLIFWRGRMHEMVHEELRRDIAATRTAQTATVERGMPPAQELQQLRLERVREELQRPAPEMVPESEELRRARAHIERLARAVAQSGSEAATAAAQALSRRIGALEGRVDLLRAKHQAGLAIDLAAGGRFDAAARKLGEATELVGKAEYHLGDGEASPSLADVRAALRDASAAVATQAADVRQQIERVLTETERVVGALERAEEQAGAGADRS